MIDTNRDLLVTFLGMIPVGNRIQRISVQVNLRTIKELQEVKNLLEMLYESGPFWPVGTFGTWRNLPAGPAPVLALTNEQKGEALVRAFMREHPSSLSFTYMNTDPNVPDHAAKRIKNNKGLKEKHADLSATSKKIPGRLQSNKIWRIYGVRSRLHGP